jgi:hypothetical protein
MMIQKFRINDFLKDYKFQKKIFMIFINSFFENFYLILIIFFL